MVTVRVFPNEAETGIALVEFSVGGGETWANRVTQMPATGTIWGAGDNAHTAGTPFVESFLYHQNVTPFEADATANATITKWALMAAGHAAAVDLANQLDTFAQPWPGVFAGYANVRVVPGVQQPRIGVFLMVAENGDITMSQLNGRIFNATHTAPANGYPELARLLNFGAITGQGFTANAQATGDPAIRATARPNAFMGQNITGANTASIDVGAIMTAWDTLHGTGTNDTIMTAANRTAFEAALNAALAAARAAGAPAP
jgi:hypothetical protein